MTMIVRIVIMTFKPDCTDEFMTIFHANKEAIRNFEGCTHLELLRDNNNPAIFTTISHWNNETFLEKYRTSPLFASVWSNVKKLFAERTRAFTMTRQVEVI
jgi:heme oxygenase (mycobilin-producing)